MSGPTSAPAGATVGKPTLDFVARFERAELPKSEWTHLAHLVVGVLYVGSVGPEHALDRLRDGIRRLNESHGVANSDTSGYHETITRAYVMLLADYLRTADSPEVNDRVVSDLLASPLAARDVLLRYYTSTRLLSTEARRTWVEPDLQPLPMDA